ncbi:MAG: DUF790 family protein [Nitrososphaeria archaeon]
MKYDIRPEYAGADHAYLVNMISEVIKGSIGKRRGEIDSRVKEIEAYGDYRMVRGFYEILLNYCTFEPEIELNPGPMRDFAFARMSEIGIYSPKVAENVISEGASKFGISRERFKSAMWSDLPENAVLREFREPTDIIMEYNFRLVSSMLTRSLYVRFWLSDKWKDALWAVKRLGLMYQLENQSILVDGPASLIHNARAYSLGISRLFYFISRAKSWWIEAGIMKGKSIRVLRASSDDPIMSGSGEVSFDSEVERKFYQDFISLKSGWKIMREPEPLRAGNYTIIPDFLFEKDGIRVYMEIVGFWTQEYLERKFRKLSELKVENLIVAIDSANYRGKIPEIAGRVMIYRKTPDAFRVRRLLSEIEQPMKDELLKRATNVKVDGDCRTLREIALGNDLPEDVLKEAFINHKPRGYIFDGSNLISEIMAKKLRDEIISLGEADANTVIEFLNKRGMDANISTLVALGFEIEWIGLEARIKVK